MRKIDKWVKGRPVDTARVDAVLESVTESTQAVTEAPAQTTESVADVVNASTETTATKAKEVTTFTTGFDTADKLLSENAVRQGRKIRRDKEEAAQFDRVVTSIPKKLKDELNIYAIRNKTNLSSIAALAIAAFAKEVGIKAD